MNRHYGKVKTSQQPFLQFRGVDGEQLGAIWLRGGKFSFEGDADKSMGVFMKAMNAHNEHLVPREDLQHAEREIERLTADLEKLQATKGRK